MRAPPAAAPASRCAIPLRRRRQRAPIAALGKNGDRLTSGLREVRAPTSPQGLSRTPPPG
jgi:hypothetical protein